jgi:hypothetical protein
MKSDIFHACEMQMEKGLAIVASEENTKNASEVD